MSDKLHIIHDPEQARAQAELELYLENRPSDLSGPQADAYFDEQRQIYQDENQRSYEEMGVLELARIAVHAQVIEDKTTERNASEALLEKIGSSPNSERLFDRVLGFMNAYRRKEDIHDTPTVPVTQIIDISESDYEIYEDTVDRSHEENILFESMLKGLDETNLNMEGSPAFTEKDFAKLVEKFARNQKDTLAPAREVLFVVGSKNGQEIGGRPLNIDRFIDAYFNLMLRLDHAAFPPTEQYVRRGVVDYVPDGFVDMGGDSEINPVHRYREMIVVDKKNILDKYKYVLKEIFTSEAFAEQPLQQRKKAMALKLGREIYRTMRYQDKDLGGGKRNLSEIDEAVCRHHALAFQVLGQAAGLKVRIFKNYLSFNGGASERHAANFIRLDNQWYIFDVTNPEREKTQRGDRWAPALYEIDRPPCENERKVWQVSNRFSSSWRNYISHDGMYWHIDKLTK